VPSARRVADPIPSHRKVTAAVIGRQGEGRHWAAHFGHRRWPASEVLIAASVRPSSAEARLYTSGTLRGSIFPDVHLLGPREIRLCFKVAPARLRQPTPPPGRMAKRSAPQ